MVTDARKKPTFAAGCTIGSHGGRKVGIFASPEIFTRFSPFLFCVRPLCGLRFSRKVRGADLINKDRCYFFYRPFFLAFGQKKRLILGRPAPPRADKRAVSYKLMKTDPTES